MGIDLENENVVLLAEAAKMLPRLKNGQPVRNINLIRAITAGKLDAVRIGGRWATSREAVKRWIGNQTEAALKAANANCQASARENSRP